MAIKEFLGNVIIFYRVRVVTGLHIGGSKEQFEIGGLDNPVIKLPEGVSPFKIKSAIDSTEIVVRSSQPYIPGSSIKGKLRALLDIAYGDFNFDEKKGETVWIDLLALLANKEESENLRQIINLRKLFGMSPSGTDEEIKKLVAKGIFPVRGRFFDAYMVSDEKDKVDITEIKYENKIDRITSKAVPRPYERVPAGTEFEGKIVIRIFDESDAELLKLLGEAFALLENDYLGGGGSRGSGRVRLSAVKVEWKSVASYRGEEGAGVKELVSDEVSPEEALFKASEKLKEEFNNTNQGA